MIKKMTQEQIDEFLKNKKVNLVIKEKDEEEIFELNEENLLISTEVIQ